MSIQESDIRAIVSHQESSKPIEEAGADILLGVLKRLGRQPSPIESELNVAKEKYQTMMSLNPDMMRSFSPVRACSAYLFFECADPLLNASKVYSGKGFLYE